MKKLIPILIILAMVVMVLPATIFAHDNTLELDNKNLSTWERIADGTGATLTYNPSGDEFEFNLVATGLDASTNYSLIYYANPYPGNNPGALIWSGDSDGTGNISTGDLSVDLGMNLPTPPDSNMLVNHCGAPNNYSTCYGAKIWLVPSSDYNVDTNSINWANPSKYLFETDLINYVDTDANSGDGSVSVTTTITEPASTIAINVAPASIAFGSVAIGQCSTEQTITITNTGNVPIIVTALASTGFYTDCVVLDGTCDTSNWESSKIDVGDSITVQVKICINTTSYSGTQTGQLSFLAQFAP